MGVGVRGENLMARGKGVYKPCLVVSHCDMIGKKRLNMRKNEFQSNKNYAHPVVIYHKIPVILWYRYTIYHSLPNTNTVPMVPVMNPNNKLHNSWFLKVKHFLILLVSSLYLWIDSGTFELPEKVNYSISKKEMHHVQNFDILVSIRANSVTSHETTSKIPWKSVYMCYLAVHACLSLIFGNNCKKWSTFYSLIVTPDLQTFYCVLQDNNTWQPTLNNWSTHTITFLLITQYTRPTKKVHIVHDKKAGVTNKDLAKKYHLHHIMISHIHHTYVKIKGCYKVKPKSGWLHKSTTYEACFTVWMLSNATCTWCCWPPTEVFPTNPCRYYLEKTWHIWLEGLYAL